MIGASVKRVYRELNETWKRSHLLQFDKTGVLGVSLPIKNLEDWVTVNRRISRIPVVEKIQVVLFSKHLIRLKMQFIGHISKLKSALILEDIERLPKKYQGWLLKVIDDRSPNSEFRIISIDNSSFKDSTSNENLRKDLYFRCRVKYTYK